MENGSSIQRRLSVDSGKPETISAMILLAFSTRNLLDILLQDKIW